MSALRGRTIIVSLVVHGALAASLLGAATRRAVRRPTSVALAEVKKAEKPRPPRPVAPPPVARKVASLPKAGPVAAPIVHTPVAAPAAVATALTLSNDDGPGGIALPTRGAPGPTAAPVTKVASAITESRRKRMQQEAGAGAGAAEEAPCAEEATKPEPVFKQEIEYTAQARSEGIEGKLKLRLTVGPDGAVVRVDVIDSVSPELDAAAIGAARLWRFKPATLCGRPTTATYVLARRFELGD